MTVMLAEEDKHGLIEHMDITEGRLLSGLPFIMDDIIR